MCVWSDGSNSTNLLQLVTEWSIYGCRFIFYNRKFLFAYCLWVGNVYKNIISSFQISSKEHTNLCTLNHFLTKYKNVKVVFSKTNWMIKEKFWKFLKFQSIAVMHPLEHRSIKFAELGDQKRNSHSRNLRNPLNNLF